MPYNHCAGRALGDRLSLLTDTSLTLNGRIIQYNGSRVGMIIFEGATSSTTSPTNTNDRNGDGKADRAGFSVIALSQDNRIWAQEDGTSQATPSLEPDGTTAGNTQTLSTQAEFTALNTTTDTQYDLAIKGDNYQLFANGSLIFSGRLRDYSAFVPASQVISGIPVNPPNPYNIANLVFLGDNTPTAQSSVQHNQYANEFPSGGRSGLQLLLIAQ